MRARGVLPSRGTIPGRLSWRGSTEIRSSGLGRWRDKRPMKTVARRIRPRGLCAANGRVCRRVPGKLSSLTITDVRALPCRAPHIYSSSRADRRNSPFHHRSNHGKTGYIQHRLRPHHSPGGTGFAIHHQAGRPRLHHAKRADCHQNCATAQKRLGDHRRISRNPRLAISSNPPRPQGGREGRVSSLCRNCSWANWPQIYIPWAV